MRLLSEVGEGSREWGRERKREREKGGERGERGRSVCPLEHLITCISLVLATSLSLPLGSKKQ